MWRAILQEKKKRQHISLILEYYPPDLLLAVRIYCVAFIFHRRSIQHLYVSFCRPFVVNTTFSAGLVGVQVTSVSCLGQLTVGVQITVIVIVGFFLNFVCCLAWAVILELKSPIWNIFKSIMILWWDTPYRIKLFQSNRSIGANISNIQ